MFTNSMGRNLTLGLFLETSYNSPGGPEAAVYTLKDHDHELNGRYYVSLPKLYLALEDPIEYEFANTYLNGWTHWLEIQRSSTLREHVNRWRKELELRIRGRALKEIMGEAASAEGKNKFTANRFLLEGGWKEKAQGRPSKEAIKREAETLFKEKDQVLDDYKRLQQELN